MTELTDTAPSALSAALTREAAAVTDLRAFNERQSVMDPAKVAWPSTLVIELALKTASPKELKEHYGFDDEEWAALRENPTFIAELKDACETVKKEGMSFKMKARLQAEALLETSWKLIHGPGSEVQAAVKAKLMEATWRMAGYDNKNETSSGVVPLAIQINLR